MAMLRQSRMITVMAALAVLALLPLLASAFTDPCDGTYKKYSPPPQVKRWTFRTFEAEVSYAEEVVYNRVIPVAAVGVVLTIGILLWWCCRCCGKCKKTDQSSMCHSFLAVMCIGMVVAGVILIIVGLSTGQKQSDAMQSLPNLISDIEAYTVDVSDVVDNIVDICNDLVDTVNDILNVADVNTILDTNDLTDFQTEVQDTQDAVEDIQTEVDDFDVDSFSQDFSDDVTDYDEQRELYLKVVLAVLFVFIALFALISFCDAWGPESCKSKNQCVCRTCTVPLRVIMLLLSLILWILAAAMLGVMTGMSDFCISANDNLFDLVKKDDGGSSDEMLSFFIYCDVNATACARSPFNDLFTDVETVFDNVEIILDDIETEFNNNCPSVSACDDVEPLLDTLIQLFDDLRDAILTDLANLISCSAINETYQKVLLAVCGQTAEALAQTMEVLLGFAVIFSFTLIFTSLLGDYEKDGTRKASGIV